MPPKPKPIGMGQLYADAAADVRVLDLEGQVETLQAEITRLKLEADNNQDKGELESKVQALVKELSNQQDVATTPIKLIARNPFQPRQIFTLANLQAFAHVLQEEGQLTPVILIPLTNDLREKILDEGKQLFPVSPVENKQLEEWQFECRFLMFDGERRGRSAVLAGWDTVKSVTLPIEEIPELLNVQAWAMSTSLHRQDLHELEIAECLIAQILGRYPAMQESLDDSPEKSIPRLLGNVISRMERAKRSREFSPVVQASRQEQQQWLETIDWKALEELEIVETILSFQLHPVTIDSNVFPLLSLPSDLKQVVLDYGLEASKVLELNRISAARLGVSEDKAQQIRADLIQEVLQERHSVRKVKERVNQVLAQYNEQLRSTDDSKMPKELVRLDKVDFNTLPKKDLLVFQQVLTRRLQELEQALAKK